MFDTQPDLLEEAKPTMRTSDARRLVADLIRSARPGQWTKNLACFAGLIFSGRMIELSAIWQASVAFLGFCLASSGIYLINDVFDLPLDRENPSKRHRPIASGRLSAPHAIVAAAVLLSAALSSSLALPIPCRVVLAGYVVMALAYSARLKHTLLVDVVIIALGFVLRVLYGVFAVEVLPSPWVVLCTFFLALFLGFAKRRGELARLVVEDHRRRPVLVKYSVDLLDLYLGMTATMAILCYTLYTVAGRSGDAELVVTVPVVVYGVSRYMHRVIVEGLGDAPERQIPGDRLLVGAVAVWVSLCVLIIYFDVKMIQWARWDG